MLTTTTDVAAVNSFYDRDLLERAIPMFLHTRWAQVRDIPANSSGVIKFRKYNSLSAATTPLVEGVTPAGSKLSITDSSATVQQYGDFVTLTDRLTQEIEDPVRLIANEVLGEQMGDTIDQLTRDVLAAGTNVQYASTAVSRITVTSAMKLNAAEIREATRTLKNANARYMTTQVDASTGYSTVPVPRAFISIVHPNTVYDLEQDSAWTPVEKYAGQSTVMEGEVGKIGQVRFIETPNAKYFAGAGDSGIDVYATLIFGANAYGITRVSSETVENIIKPLGSAGTSDPLNQRETSGWKTTFVAKILQQAWLIRIEHAVS